MKEQKTKSEGSSELQYEISGHAGDFNSLKKGKIGPFEPTLLPAGIARETCGHISKLYFATKRIGNLSLLMIKKKIL